MADSESDSTSTTASANTEFLSTVTTAMDIALTAVKMADALQQDLDNMDDPDRAPMEKTTEVILSMAAEEIGGLIGEAMGETIGEMISPGVGGPIGGVVGDADGRSAGEAAANDGPEFLEQLREAVETQAEIDYENDKLFAGYMLASDL